MSRNELIGIEPDAPISYIPTSAIHDIRGNGSGFPDPSEFNLIRWKSGKRVDQRLLALLNFLRELFVGRREFFKEIFPGIQHEFSELFDKIGPGFLTRDANESKTIQRSASFDTAKGSGLKLGRFKVQTPDLIVETPPGSSQGGQGDNKSKPK